MASAPADESPSDSPGTSSLPEDSAPAAPQPTALLAGKRVVIVEDEGVMLMQLKRILTRAGCQVVATAINGQEGVEAALNERPDLILMDIRMPVMNGLDAARRILAEFRVCLVMLTAFSDEATLVEAENMGASGYIVKPVTADVLLPQLERAWRAFEGQ